MALKLRVYCVQALRFLGSESDDVMGEGGTKGRWGDI